MPRTRERKEPSGSPLCVTSACGKLLAVSVVAFPGAERSTVSGSAPVPRSGCRWSVGPYRTATTLRSWPVTVSGVGSEADNLPKVFEGAPSPLIGHDQSVTNEPGVLRRPEGGRLTRSSRGGAGGIGPWPLPRVGQATEPWAVTVTVSVPRHEIFISFSSPSSPGPAPRGGAGGDQVSRLQGHDRGDVRDEARDVPDQVGEASALPHRPVDPAPQSHVLDGPGVVRGDQVGPGGRERVEGLAGRPVLSPARAPSILAQPLPGAARLQNAPGCFSDERLWSYLTSAGMWHRLLQWHPHGPRRPDWSCQTRDAARPGT